MRGGEGGYGRVRVRVKLELAGGPSFVVLVCSLL